MATADIRPVEGITPQDNGDDDPPLFPHIAWGVGDQNPKANPEQVDEEEPQNEENGEPEVNAEPEGNEDPQPEGQVILHPRVRRRVDVDYILEDIAQPGPTTRSRTCLANFYGNFCFVSMTKPSKFEQAMQDPNWILAMQEEFKQFHRNKVWSLVKRPDPSKHNIIGTKWIFRNK